MEERLDTKVAKDKIAQMGAGMAGAGVLGNGVIATKIVTITKATALGASIAASLATPVAIAAGVGLIGFAALKHYILSKRNG